VIIIPPAPESNGGRKKNCVEKYPENGWEPTKTVTGVKSLCFLRSVTNVVCFSVVPQYKGV